MVSLPPVYAPLVRTDFTDDAAWAQVVDECTRPSPEDFLAGVEPVDDPALDGATWESLRDAAMAAGGGSVLFVVDAVTLASAEHPVLVVSTNRYSARNHPDEVAARRPFRCIPAKLWSPENNLNLANMDWSDFAESADADGVFRGF